MFRSIVFSEMDVVSSTTSRLAVYQNKDVVKKWEREAETTARLGITDLTA
jgi:hypothetical protein